MPKKQPESFNIGDLVQWTSQSAGYTKTKAGVVVQEAEEAMSEAKP